MHEPYCSVKLGTCGVRLFSIVFFISFYVLVSFILLNVIIGKGGGGEKEWMEEGREVWGGGDERRGGRSSGLVKERREGKWGEVEMRGGEGGAVV